MEGLGKVQRLKKYMESCGAKFPQEADYGKRKNRQSTFTSYLYLYYIAIFRQCQAREARILRRLGSSQAGQSGGRGRSRK